MSFWTAAWAVRDAIPVQYPVLLFGLAVTGGYYFAASLVFPRMIPDGVDLDGHYFTVKKWVVVVVAVCNLAGSAGMAIAGVHPFQDVTSTALNLLFFGMLAVLFVVRARIANLILLIMIVGLYPAASLLVSAFG